MKAPRREAWRTAAETMDAVFVEGRKELEDEIRVQRGPWFVRIRTFFVMVGNAPILTTGARAYFRAVGDFELKVRRRNTLDDLLERLGWRKPVPVDPALLNHHLVRGKPRSRIPSLFTTSGLAEAILSVGALELDVRRPSRKSRRRYGQDCGVVSARMTGLRTEPHELAGLARVVVEALEGLSRVGAARSEPVVDAKEQT